MSFVAQRRRFSSRPRPDKRPTNPVSSPTIAPTAGKGNSPFAAAQTALHQHLHPFGLADLRGLGLKPDQDYDVSVVLHAPRSPNNLAVGNFMVELALAAAGGSALNDAITAAARLPPANPRDFIASDGRRVVFAAARPALMAYADPLVAQATRLALLPLHVFAPEAAASARLVLPMAESLAFRGGSNQARGLPSVLFLEVRAGGANELQTYAAEVVFAARLRGLRWLMYHHRIFSFLLLTTTWWLVEVLFMVAVFVVAGMFLSGGDRSGAAINGSDTSSSSTPPALVKGLPSPVLKKEEEEDESDEEQSPWRRTEAAVKTERSDGPRLASIPAATARTLSQRLAGDRAYEEDAEDTGDAPSASEDGDDLRDDSSEANDNDIIPSRKRPPKSQQNRDSSAAVATGRSATLLLAADSPVRQRAPSRESPLPAQQQPSNDGPSKDSAAPSHEQRPPVAL